MLLIPYVMFEWKKTQILIAHQKEGVDLDKKIQLEDFAHIFVLLTTPYGMFEWKKKSNSYC